MRHFWFTDQDGNNIMTDHRGTLKGAVIRCKDYLKKYPECETIYINEDEDIVETVFSWEVHDEPGGISRQKERI